MTKVMRKEARHTQRRDRASGVPLEILEHIPPKPESASFLLVVSPKPLTLRGALPHYLSLKKELAYTPGGTSGKESACQRRRHKRRGFDPWVRKIPWRRTW